MIVIVDMNREKNSLAHYEYVLPLVEVAKDFGECKVVHYSDISEDYLVGAERVILSGVPLMDNNLPVDSFSWLKDFKKPVLGICAGMQLIGSVFGSEVISCQEIGMTRVVTESENPLFEDEFEVYALHSRSIVPSGEFVVLAKSSKCIAAVKHKGLQIYGLQFHPEVRKKGILEKFCAL